ncbi:PAS domain-containing protein [Mucilaginibacter sp. 14171R-50]|uniref:PAS domain-containing sensor histidine kinase n=1 Tax=Mucilaginibacter sp. 14171R-50 TaxID=2703789 RepID=UPI00138DB231|nr:ATP-binding protein [Mucilaginibacter sp. 14171R-50]QHS57475.1 PAS domain-containing protein [Mucilaginibacter sp. 14171R-50]
MEPTESLFRDIVEISPFPVYVCTGNNMIISVANNATLKAWDRDASVIGKPFFEALPELEDQPFLGYLQGVYRTGKPFHSDAERADLLVGGKMQTFYYKFTYQPMFDAEGKVYGVAAFNTDVTELERARQAVEESEMTLYNLVRQAPVGICIIRAEDLMIEVVNDSYLKLVGKRRKDMENHSIWEAIPEAAQLYAPIMNNVISSGVAFSAREHEVFLIRNGEPEIVFIDFVYEPVLHFDGTINTIMIIAIEVTDKVVARRNIEDVEERGRLAIEAAEIGTFDLDMNTDTLVTSDRFNSIFGFTTAVSRKKLAGTFHVEDQELRIRAHEAALKSGYLFYEARVIHPDDSVHWIRSQAKVYYDNDDKPKRMLGTVLDITEFKRLQQQKDDFISVASHELKTPMTSLKASIQILDKLIKNNSNPEKVSVFIEKANTSLTKMHHLIESLLNVSKITAGQLALNKTHFKADEMISESCDHILLNGDHSLELTGDTDVELFADRSKIEQVVINLVNNAIKYAPLSYKIIIDVRRQRRSVKISVQDFGEGIAYDKIPHLFERYYRVDSTGLQYSGLGLGLYISAEIIERHNGKIGVNSEAGKGSTFWFTLPVS